MLKRLQDLFTTTKKPDDEALLYQQHLAIAILLMEVARSDHDLQQPELDRLLQVLERQWSLSGTEARALLDEAAREVDVHTSLHDHLKIVNNWLDTAQKTTLIRNLWEVAVADGEIHHWEEHLIRRLADMLGVSHKDFIHGKIHALEIDKHQPG